MMSLFDTILENTAAAYSAPRILSEQHDMGKIIPVSSDPREGVGYGIRRAISRAGLNQANGRISVFSAMETPWHGLGTVIDRAATAAEALQLANLAGWDLQKIRQFAKFNGIEIPTDNFAIVRGDTGDYLGSVGSRYTVVSNEKCFAMMDDLIGEGHAHYETAGALGKGETAWMLARLPQPVKIAGNDELLPYLLCSTSHDGTASIRIAPTMERPCCKNTLRIALQGARGKGVCLRHTTNVAGRVKEVRRALGLAQKSIDKFGEEARQLATTQLYPHEYFAGCLDDILDATVADQTVTSTSLKDGSLLDAILKISSPSERRSESEKLDRAKARRKELLDDMMDRYESDRNNGMPGIGGTAWAAYNAVSEQIDHSPLFRANKDAESRFERVLLGAGDDQKQAAFSRALAMTV